MEVVWGDRGVKRGVAFSEKVGFRSQTSASRGQNGTSRDLAF